MVEDFTYTLQRAPVDETNTPGNYADVQVSKLNADGTYSDASIKDVAEKDALDQPKASPLYDRGIPAAGGKYQYRIKATKTGADDKYLTWNSSGSAIITVDPLSSVLTSSGDRPTISIGSPAVEGTGDTRKLVYSITPDALAYKDALQSGDKLVVYWAKSTSSEGYTQGIWIGTQKVEFDKAKLEGTDRAKTFTVSYPSTSSEFIFVQAFLETASGKKKIAVANSNGNYNWSYGGAIQSGIQTFYINGGDPETRYAAQLSTF
jgi:hypothetical protein